MIGRTNSASVNAVFAVLLFDMMFVLIYVEWMFLWGIKTTFLQ
jgi:hypothetical protein